MTKLPAWHRDAPAPKAKTPKGRAMWATVADPIKDRDPKKCIAAGGRMRCMDCRCGKPSPKNVTQETMPDYGTKSGHGRKKDTDKIPRRFRCIEDPSAGLLRMIGNKRALMGGPLMAEGEDE